MVLSLSMGWRHVLFANYPVDADLLAAHLPDALTVDAFDGTGWLSVVPFTNVDVRPTALPAGTGLPLPELNLRTYVTCDGEPGVYFFSLDAEGVLAVLGARVFHHLPYYYARISMDVADGRIRFRSRRRHPGERPVNYAATYEPAGDAFESSAAPLAEFLTERYRFYTQAADGSLRYADVSHDPWTLYPAEMRVAENSLFEANGLDHPEATPTCYYSPGVDVTASRSKRWEGSR